MNNPDLDKLEALCADYMKAHDAYYTTPQHSAKWDRAVDEFYAAQRKLEQDPRKQCEMFSALIARVRELEKALTEIRDSTDVNGRPNGKWHHHCVNIARHILKGPET
jgi:hypothetical protein